MVAKGFESVGLPALVRPARSGFDAAAFRIVSLIGSVGRLVVLGRILWGKIKRHVIRNLSPRSLAIWCEYVVLAMYSDIPYTFAVLRLSANIPVNILPKMTLLELLYYFGRVVGDEIIDRLRKNIGSIF